MVIDERRRVENFAIVCPLKDIEDGDMLAFLAGLIQDHDHLRSKLMTEPDKRKRGEKLEAMRAHLEFKASPLHVYEMAEMARSCGVQPIYEEQAAAERSRLIAPPSFIHEVRG
jgi:hypothetical protein